MLPVVVSSEETDHAEQARDRTGIRKVKPDQSFIALQDIGEAKERQLNAGLLLRRARDGQSLKRTQRLVCEDAIMVGERRIRHTHRHE